ncbi:MAG: TlpA family protein disulfide reductase [Spirochaetales bacterium]|nr:MAG: TlpA family protein disulfide reductase [Spirochaetales bacterium]
MKKIWLTALLTLLAVGFLWARGKREKEPSPPPVPQTVNTAADNPQTPAGEGEFKPSPEQAELAKLGFSFPTQAFAAPDFILKNLAGESKTLTSYRGKIVFLNFWATWCPPCREEMPSIEKLHREFKNEPFVILAIDLREDLPTVAKFIKDNKYTYEILLDETGLVGGDLYGVEGIPTTYIIGKDGRIIGRLVGTRQWTGEEVYSVFRGLTKG